MKRILLAASMMLFASNALAFTSTASSSFAGVTPTAGFTLADAYIPSGIRYGGRTLEMDEKPFCTQVVTPTTSQYQKIVCPVDGSVSRAQNVQRLARKVTVQCATTAFDPYRIDVYHKSDTGTILTAIITASTGVPVTFSGDIIAVGVWLPVDNSVNAVNAVICFY